MLPASLALEKELCRRRIEVIEWLEKNLNDLESDNYDDWDRRYAEELLTNHPDVETREAFIASLGKATEFDEWAGKRSKGV
jgi:hypothetical protein